MEREISKKYQQKLGNMDLEILETATPAHNRSSGVSSSRPGRSTLATRELNPALFGETANRSRVIEGSMQTESPHFMQNDQKMNDIRQQMSTMAEHLGKLTQQFNEWAKSGHSKFERLQAQMTKLEQNDHYIVTEAAQKFSQVNTRFGERKSIDIKTHEMMDRHNSVLKSFEMRLTQMQRILAEKEAQLLATTAALNESKMEIARLKRM